MQSYLLFLTLKAKDFSHELKKIVSLIDFFLTSKQRGIFSFILPQVHWTPLTFDWTLTHIADLKGAQEDLQKIDFIMCVFFS